MYFKTLISTDALAGLLEDPDWAVLDCRYSLADAEKGCQDYLQAHIPGAVYLHLSEDLSGPKLPGITGRHPLPEVVKAGRVFAAAGIAAGVQVVCYDDAYGALAAVRAWWMLRWLGHDRVSVLDGGWQKWLAEDRPVRGGQETHAKRQFTPKPVEGMVVSAAEVNWMRLDPHYKVFDGRAAERYRGENETIDPVAGHIPGAHSIPYMENLNPDGTFKSPEDLQAYYLTKLDGTPAERAVFYCGSGVTSIHNILALQHAGLGEGRLYAGSWSEWITDPARPLAVGDDL